MKPTRARIGAFFFRYRNAIGPLLFLAALLAGHARYPFGRSDFNLLLDAAGAGVALLGQALRIVTIGYEYIERGGRNRQVYASKLVQGGVFAHCRNPLYAGNLLLALGLALIVHSSVFYLAGLPLVLFAYVCIVAAEEEFLHAQFGADYAAYCDRVPRWFPRWVPRWRDWRASIAGMRFNWRRVLVKEYNTIFLLALALPLAKLWADYQVSGPAVLPAAPVLASALGLWLASYLLVRAMKKSGYVSA